MRSPRLLPVRPPRTAVCATPARNRGTALLEFAIAAPPLLLLGLLAVEAAHWHLARQVAYVALLDAARAGATGHGAPDAMARAFERALRPRYASPDSDAQAAQQRAFQRLRSQAGMAPWRIEVLQPSAAAFQVHARRGLAVPAAPGRRAISNDYQAEQHAARGGEPTIFEANILHARLTFLHEPLSPLVRALLRRAGQAGSGCTARAWSRGVLPLKLELRIEMQSHPADWHAWPAARRGPVVYGTLACAWDDS